MGGQFRGFWRKNCRVDRRRWSFIAIFRASADRAEERAASRR
jgi:hypothetical protein